MVISEIEKKQTAYHEAGHVLVAKMTPGSDPVHKVTIIPRGRALGLTHYLPLDEKHNYSRSYLLQTLVHLLGGRAAEKVIFNELSTGAGNDIERATEITRKMVCEWGMSEKIGPVSYGSKNSEVFLGRDFAQQRNYSERTAQDIDAEIRRIVSTAEQKAEKIIRDNVNKLHLLANSLLEREILDGEEIETLIKGGKLPPVNDKNNTKKTKPERKPEQPQQKLSVVLPKSEVEEKKTTEKKVPSHTSTGRRGMSRYGVASSRDPENRRPSPRQLGKEEYEKTAKIESKEKADKDASSDVKPEAPKKPRRRRRTVVKAKPTTTPTPTTKDAKPTKPVSDDGEIIFDINDSKDKKQPEKK